MQAQAAVGSVTVVIPAYNMAALVGQAVRSVLSQTYQPREILVIDDGSTDSTASVVSGFGDRVRLIRKPNGGLSSARNRGIDEAKGEYIAYLDADDSWESDKLQMQVDLLRNRPDVGFCSTEARLVDADGKDLGRWKCPDVDGDALKRIFQVNATVAGSGSSVVVRSALQRRAGPFDESLNSLEDIDMWMRLAALSGYVCIPRPLTIILKRADSMSRQLDRMRGSAMQVLKKNRALLAPTDQGRFWQGAYAAMLTDYAKWEYRSGRKALAMAHLGEAAVRAPLARGRLCVSLFIAMARGVEL